MFAHMFAPSLVDEEPPSYARTMYKVVALVDGQAVSIFDGQTWYPQGVTVYQPVAEDHGGGLYCFRTLEECLGRDESMLPRGSALLHAPRAIARVLAWNPEGTLPVAYGTKKAFSCMRLLELLPMPLTWGMRSDVAGVRCHAPTAATAGPVAVPQQQGGLRHQGGGGTEAMPHPITLTSSSGTTSSLSTTGGTRGSGNASSLTLGQPSSHNTTSPMASLMSLIGSGGGSNVCGAHQGSPLPAHMQSVASPARASPAGIATGGRDRAVRTQLLSPTAGQLKGPPPSLVRRQAATVQLEWEVARLEAAVASARGLGMA